MSETAPHAPSTTAGASARRPVVLVADDYPENRRLLFFYLRDQYEVLQAATAEEAIAVLHEQQQKGTPVDIAILDLNFCDGMSGIDAIQEIRQDPVIAHVRALALTAYAYPDDRQRCLDAGFDAYVAKPVFKPGLLDKLGGLLGDSGDGAAPPADSVWISRPDTTAEQG